MKVEDFSFKVNSDSYSIYYLGQFVSGASVQLPRAKPLHWKHARQNIADFRDICVSDIKQYVNGTYKLPLHLLQSDEVNTTIAE